MAKQKSVFLDVDSKIIENNLLIKNDDGEDFDSLFGFNKKSTEDETWKRVVPTPGMVLKTTNSEGKKIFVNLCHTSGIPEPKDISESELIEVWYTQDSSKYRVPLSIFDLPHNELDKKGNEVPVYDVAVNTKYYEKVKNQDVFLSFLVQLIFQGLENKFDLELEKEDYVVLRNRTHIGELKSHIVRNSKGQYEPPRPLIEELESVKTVESKCIKSRLMQKENLLLGEFHLPNIIKSDDVELDVGEDRIVINTKNKSYSQEYFLPCKICENDCSAYFNTSTNVLKVLMKLSV